MSGEIEVTARGHLAADAVVKTVGAELVAELRLAVGIRRKDAASGDWSDVRTDWVDVSVWGWNVAAVRQLLKGQLVEVRGRLTPTAYLTKAGEAAPSLSISARSVLIVPRAPQAVAA
jgi:single-strand DNA-binding protein